MEAGEFPGNLAMIGAHGNDEARERDETEGDRAEYESGYQEIEYEFQSFCKKRLAMLQEEIGE